MAIAQFFSIFIYQPFFNLLVFLYWLLGQVSVSQPDMGVAVIILTIIIRILLLPMSLSGMKGERERRQIAAQVRELQAQYRDDPVKYREAKRLIFQKSRHVVGSELFSLSVQVGIALMLWKIFKTGLEGADLHLIYSFMPKVEFPFNLMFLGRFDLSQSSFTLNLLQSLLIFVLETLSVLTSPFPHTRAEVVRLQLTLPILSFLIFMFMPAGKKLFVITTLIFSILLTIVKFIRRKFLDYKEKVEKKEQSQGSQSAEEKLVEVVR
jgi:YidC/Oxa1 family membrane protein insertase